MKERTSHILVYGVELATAYTRADKEVAGLLIVNGGANIPIAQSPYPEWQGVLGEKGISSLSFDFRGVGDSGVALFDTSLLTRREDVRAALDLFKTQSSKIPMYVMGVSMGAPLAIELALSEKLAGLILTSPAAYSAEAREKNFGEAFSQAIRKPRSWEGSPEFENLKAYNGKMLLAYGVDDDIVPQEILREYDEIVGQKRGNVLRLHAGHRFMREGDQASSDARTIFTNAVVELFTDK